MPPLRDMRCTGCDAVVENVFCDTPAVLQCHYCGTETEHRDTCRGGTKTRYRFCDWPSDPAFYRGQTTTTPPTVHVHDAETGEEEPSVHRHTGRRMDSQPRFDPEPRLERLDMIHHDTDRKRGHLPLTFDQGSHE